MVMSVGFDNLKFVGQNYGVAPLVTEDTISPFKSVNDDYENACGTIFETML
jgi:hypothetical protein